jgi:pimeloyl-ACP methyl ester carboxylesterase
MKNTLLILSLFMALVATSLWFATPDLPEITAEDRSIAQTEGSAFSFVELTDGTVHYRLEGPELAPTLVLIHGFSTPSFVWDDHYTPLIQAGFRVLSFDNYGRGFSDRPDGPYSADRTDKLITELLDHVGITRPVHLVGYSMGGATAAIFAERHPAKTRSLTLIAPAGTGDSPLLLDILALPVLGDGIINALGPLMVGNNARTAAQTSPNPEQFLSSFEKQTEFAGYYDALLSTMRHYPLSSAQSSFAALGQSALPIQMIWGETDERVPFALSEPMQTLLPQAKLHRFPGVGHSITFSHADKVSPLLISFVEEHRLRQSTGGPGGKARGPEARMEPVDCLCHGDTSP